MAYIGQNADGNFTTSVSKDTFSGNGSTTAFTLSEAATTNTVDVFVENIRQEPTTAYTVDGTTLTFTAAPVTGTNNIYVVNRGPIQLSASHPAAQSLSAFSATITNDLTVDTNTLFVDASENKVGVGTTTVTDAGVTMTPSVTRAGGWDAHLALQSTAADDFPALLFSNAATNRYGGIVSVNDASGNVTNNVTAQIDFFMSSATDGNIRVRTNTDVGSSAPVTQWQFTHDGNLKAEVNGNGIDFSASAGSGAASSVLDDYEEGAWTPTVAQGWTSVSFPNSYQFGRYTKIGNTVTAWFWLQFNGTSAGNQVLIGGLPFTTPAGASASGELAHRGGAVTYFTTPVNAAGAITAYTGGGSTQIQFYAFDDGGASALSNANASNEKYGNVRIHG